MVSFIDEQRGFYGVEPICTVLPIAASTYYEKKAQRDDPSRVSLPARRDEGLCQEIRRVWTANRKVYGARKVWHQLRREGIEVARCTIERLMQKMGLQGAVRGGKQRTTTPCMEAAWSKDLVDRMFTASGPNRLWVADLTYVTVRGGLVYVAFVVDVFSRKIVGGCASRSLGTELALDALDQALYSRHGTDGLIHHSDRGTQYVSVRYTDRLLKAGMEPSVGSVGDSYDNALAESVIGLYKTEVICRLGPWRNAGHVEFETLDWVDWFNSRWLLEPIGYIPPDEFERIHYQNQEHMAMVAGLN